MIREFEEIIPENSQKDGEPFSHEHVRIALPVRVLEEHSCSYQEFLVLICS